MYIDSSIRIFTDKIGFHLTKLRNTNFLTQYLKHNFSCYTDPLMFKWFKENLGSFQKFYTIEANILLFQRSLLSSLIMKAWVTCALDENCISPPGSKLTPCCGCHRYDQAAITIVSSYFYGYPKNIDSELPVFALSKSEYFFSIRRYEAKAYFIS